MGNGARAHAVKQGLWSLVSVVGDVAPPTTHRGNREVRAILTAQIDSFEAEAQRLDADLWRARNEVGELTAERDRLNGRIARFNSRIVVLEQLDRPTREIVSEINERLARRTSRMIATNISSMAIEAVSYAGAADIVGITFMEVRDACLTLADTHKMSQLISGESEAEVPACGYSPMEFWDILDVRPDTTSCRNLSANMPAELQLDCLTILRPGEPEPPDTDSSP